MPNFLWEKNGTWDFAQPVAQDDDENDQDADIEDEKVTFLIGQQSDEENEIPKHRQMIYDNNVQTKKKRRKKKRSKGRKHSNFTEEELKV